MKSQRSNYSFPWALFVLLFFLAVAAMAQSRHRQMMTDQLFGISYDPEKVHFEKMPTALAKTCPGLRGRYVAAWVYGHFKTSDSEYFLISGLMEFHEEGGARAIAPEEDDGLAVALKGPRCSVDEAGYFLGQMINTAKGATPIMVPRSVLIGILQDAFQRYVVAFGGKQEFLKRVKHNGALPVVREQLEAFQKESGE